MEFTRRGCKLPVRGQVAYEPPAPRPARYTLRQTWEAQILSVLAHGQIMAFDDICSAIPASRDRIGRILSELARDGTIDRVARGEYRAGQKPQQNPVRGVKMSLVDRRGRELTIHAPAEDGWHTSLCGEHGDVPLCALDKPETVTCNFCRRIRRGKSYAGRHRHDS